ncbi:MAG: aldo/keto reductase [Tepidisphaerales bacterium]
MQYRMLGKTNLRVSVIGLGTWQFGGEWGKSFTVAEVEAIVHRAADLGINLIDTAECYGDHLAESLLGPAIAGQRDRWIIATKFGHKFLGHMNRAEPRSAPEVMQQLEDSLRALCTDYVDIYQYHSMRNSEFDDIPLREALAKATQQGKIRHIGASISPPDNLHQTDGAAGADVEVIQVVYNRLERKAEAAVLPSCQRQNLGVLARVPLASGYLSGKYKAGATFAADDWRSGHNPADVAAKLAEVARIVREEVPPGVPVARWALAWCLKNPAISSIIPGCKTVEQLEANAAAV